MASLIDKIPIEDIKYLKRLKIIRTEKNQIFKELVNSYISISADLEQTCMYMEILENEKDKLINMVDDYARRLDECKSELQMSNQEIKKLQKQVKDLERQLDTDYDVMYGGIDSDDTLSGSTI